MNSMKYYEGKDHLDYGSFVNVEPWVQRCASRPAAERGRAVCGFN
jgi:hypothetical protein